MRAILTWVLALGLAGGTAAFADSGKTKSGASTETAKTETAKTATPAPPGAPGNSAAAKTPEPPSALAAEVQRLQEMIEAQAKQLDDQQKAIEAQRKQISDLESRLTPGRSAATNETTSAAVPAASATAPGAATAPGKGLASATSAGTAALSSSLNAPPASTRAGGAPSAQDKGPKLGPLALANIQIGATFYGDWAYYTDTGFGPQFLTQLNQDGPGNAGFNSFDVTRAYINFLYTPIDAVTLRLTPNIYRQVDVSGAISNGKGSGIASSSNGNLGFRLKYSYAQFNTLFKESDALKKDNLRVGQQMNPLVDWEEGLWGYRYVSLVPWNYLSLSSTYTGVALNGPIEFNGKEYLDYQIGAFNTASFHAIETNDKKQGMARLTWYPLGTTSDRTGLGVTGFEDYGYNTKTPDAISTPLNRLAALVHYQSHSKGFLVAGEYDLGRNAFSTGNLFSGAGPGDQVGLGPTPYATFSSLASALLAGNRTRQQGFDFFGHVRLGHTPFSLFGMYQYFQPNTLISGTNPLDFERTVGGISYKYNDHFEFSFDDQNLNYFHKQFTMSAAQIATFSSSLAAANKSGIPNVVPNGTNAFFINLLFNY